MIDGINEEIARLELMTARISMRMGRLNDTICSDPSFSGASGRDEPQRIECDVETVAECQFSVSAAFDNLIKVLPLLLILERRVKFHSG